MKAVSTRENNFWHRQEIYGGIIIGLSFFALTVLTVKLFAPQIDTDAITQDDTVIAGPYTISISNDSSVNIAITPTSTQTIYNGTNNVNVMNTCPAGAAVTMTTGSATSNDLIRPALENDTAPNTIAATTTTTLDNNSWGYALNNSSIYYAVPKLGDTSAVIYDADAAQATALAIPVKFGIKTDNNLPSGTYANDVVYTLTPKAGCLTYGITWDFAGGNPKANTTYPTELEWGKAINLSQMVPTREGYNFNGWISDGGFSGTSATSDINPNNNTSITMTARWSLVDYTRSYYSSGQQSLTLPYSGYYKLEVWGGQGGSATFVESGKNYKSDGGYGGYAVGVSQLNKNTVLYIGVGGQGIPATWKNGNGSFSWSTVAYNGGSYAQYATNNSAHGGGGGATHIALVSGELKTLSAYKGTLINNTYYDSSDILIVAGGGGGASSHITDGNQYSGPGGAGGGYIGNNSGNTTSVCSYCYFWGKGGTQTDGGISTYVTGNPPYDVNQAAGSFGQGGNVASANSGGETSYYSGGGGGWFGGAAAAHNAGAGGSGYIGSSKLISGFGITKHMTCYSCTPSSAAETRTYSNTTTPASGVPDTATTGVGYARVVWLGDTL